MNWMLIMLFAALSLISLPAESAEKITIGGVEDIILLPWGEKIPARIDTGAATSSLDVCNYEVAGKYVTFTLSDRCGGIKERRPLIRWKNVHTSVGSARRPVIMMEICLGARRVKTHVTITDRSGMDYPFLVGRKTLRGKYIVDVSRARVLPPNCQDAKTDIKLNMKPDIKPQ